MSMENSRDIEDYLQSMLDLSNPEHRQFVEILLNQLGHSFANDSQDTTLHVKRETNTATKAGASVKGKQQAHGNPNSKPNSKETEKKTKKKPKQVNLFSAEGKAKESITLPGQHK